MPTCGGRDTARMTRRSTGRVLATLSPPNPAQIIGSHSLASSPDGQWLIAAKDDGETIAWDLPLIRCELDKLGLDWTDSEPELTERQAGQAHDGTPAGQGK